MCPEMFLCDTSCMNLLITLWLGELRSPSALWEGLLGTLSCALPLQEGLSGGDVLLRARSVALGAMFSLLNQDL